MGQREAEVPRIWKDRESWGVGLLERSTDLLRDTVGPKQACRKGAEGNTLISPSSLPPVSC